MQTNLVIEYIDISELTPYENNAKTHPNEQVEHIGNSIETFDFNDPIGVWGKDNIVVEGHGRLLAAQKHGIDKLPCIRLDHLTEEQAKAYRLAHNQTNISGGSGWDFELLNIELEEINIEMADFGFEFEDLSIDNVAGDYNNFEDIGDKSVTCPECSHIFTP